MKLSTSPINRAQGLGEEGGGQCHLLISVMCSLSFPLTSHVGKTYRNIQHLVELLFLGSS
jgi:hypothetical protein